MSFETSLYDDFEDEPIISFALAPTALTEPLIEIKTVKNHQEIPFPIQENALETIENSFIAQKRGTVLEDHRKVLGKTFDLLTSAQMEAFNVEKEPDAEKEKYGKHFSTSEELSEFHNDGVEILEYVRKKRSVYWQ